MPGARICPKKERICAHLRVWAGKLCFSMFISIFRLLLLRLFDRGCCESRVYEFLGAA